MPVQKFGAQTGLTQGQILVTHVVKPVAINLCKHIETTKGSTASCNLQPVLFKNLIRTTSLGELGDSGALVLTTGTCPQPVGLLEGGDSGKTVSYVIPMANVTAGLISASAGAYTNLSVVPGGGGCTPASTAPDSDVVAAMDARPALLELFGSNPNFQNCIVDIAIDLSQSTATLDTTAVDGSVVVNGVSETCTQVVQNNVAAMLGSQPSYNGVPVETSTIETVDTADDTVFSSVP